MIRVGKFTEEEFEFTMNILANWIDDDLITGFNLYDRIVYPDVEIPFNYLHGDEEHRIILCDKIKSIATLKNLIKDIESQTFRRSALYKWEKDFKIPKEKDGSVKKNFEIMLLREGIIFSKDQLAEISTIEEVYDGEGLLAAIEGCYDISFPVDSKNQALTFIDFLNEYVFAKKTNEHGYVIRDERGKPKEDAECLEGSYVVPVIILQDKFNLLEHLETFSEIKKIMVYREGNEISFCIDSNYRALKETEDYVRLKARFPKDFHDDDIFGNNEFVRYLNTKI